MNSLVAEQNSPTPENQLDSNVQFLEQGGEVGALLLPLYIEAVRHEPRLAEVKLVETSLEAQEKGRHRFARPSWHKDSSGSHEVHIRTDEGMRDKDQQSLHVHPQDYTTVAEMLGISQEEMTVDQLMQFGFLHELGHTVLYDKYSGQSAKYRKLVREEKAKLPMAPDGNPLYLQTPEGRTYVEEHWDEISAKYNISTYEELEDLQWAVYRELKQERFADEFAARIMTGKPKRGRFLGKLAGSRF